MSLKAASGRLPLEAAPTGRSSVVLKIAEASIGLERDERSEMSPCIRRRIGTHTLLWMWSLTVSPPDVTSSWS